MPISNHEQAVLRGRLGGKRTRAKMLAKNPYYYEEIGLLGGNAMKRIHGSDYYSRISKEWWQKQRGQS